MAAPTTPTTRPSRWDKPFDPRMTAETIDRLLRIPPFREMDPSGFPRTLPLREVLGGDTRVVEFPPGQVIFREGDYGASAFLLLDGRARVALESLGGLDKGHTPAKKAGWLRTLARVVRRPGAPESRGGAGPATERRRAARPVRDGVVFLQDVPGVVAGAETAPLGPGELFGEFGALTRMPRPATVFAEDKTIALEVRWQGLRDLMRYAPALREHVHRQYRENHLRRHLRETPLLARLSEGVLDQVAAAAEFAFHGNFEWQNDLDAGRERRHPPTLFERVAREPIVVEEGDAAEALLLVRGGFARCSVRRGAGRQTTAYLGRGHVFGAEELARELITGEPTPVRRTLHAVGYLDLVRLPKRIVLDAILPTLPREELQELADSVPAGLEPGDPATGDPDTGDPGRMPSTVDAPPLAPATLDFLVDQRLVNGVEAMVIDLDRCTRCDDCVRACAATHGGNPRFVRQGPVHDHFQFANACMHCVDPVCMIGCPTGAIHRDAATGVVQINDPTCIGCGTCADSCPYHNIRMVDIRDGQGALLFDESTGQPIVKATKCDLCVDVHSGPACQNACPHDALVRIDASTTGPLGRWMPAAEGPSPDAA